MTKNQVVRHHVSRNALFHDCRQKRECSTAYRGSSSALTAVTDRGLESLPCQLIRLRVRVRFIEQGVTDGPAAPGNATGQV